MSRSRIFFGLAVLFAYAIAILSIGIKKDWRLMHEDNGAFYSSLALSHLKLGLKETKGHDVLFNPHNGQKTIYGHHPPALALTLAGAFVALGSADPWAARIVPIGFHLMSLALMIIFLRLFFDWDLVLAGGFLMATLPMSSFFGRMPGYEPLGLCAFMIQLVGYAFYQRRSGRWPLFVLISGVLAAGLIDWAPLYLSVVLFVVETLGYVRGKNNGILALALTGAGAAIAALSLGHMAWANNGSLEPFFEALRKNPSLTQTEFSFVSLLLTQVEIVRRYFTHAGLTCLVLTAAIWLRHGPSLLFRVYTLAFTAGLLYVASIPRYAKTHHYAQFYLIPVVVISLVFGWQILRRKLQENRNKAWVGLAGIFWLEILTTSSVTLYKRHAKPSQYALDKTQEIRSLYLYRDTSGAKRY